MWKEGIERNTLIPAISESEKVIAHFQMSMFLDLIRSDTLKAGVIIQTR